MNMAAAPVSGETQRARRGDLVVVHTTHLDYIIGQGAQAHEEFTVGVVTNITREGNVKAYRPVGWGATVRVDSWGRRLVKVYVMPQDRIDVVGAQKTASEHTWPGGSTPRYYDTLEQAKAALRPHVIKTLGVKR